MSARADCRRLLAPVQVDGTIAPFDTLRYLGQRGIASYMEVGWSLHTFYEDPAQLSVATRRQLSPFVNYTRYMMGVSQIEQVVRAGSPWIAGIMNDLEFPPWTSDFPDLDERLGNRPSASAEWPSFTDWPTPNAHASPAGTNWTLERLFFNMPRATHHDGGVLGSTGAVMRIAGSAGGASASMVAQLFRPRAPTLARIDLWLRLTAVELPALPYLSYFVAPLRTDGTPDTDHPVLCATPRPQPSILPYATGKFIKCGLHATELASLVNPNATEPVRANSSSWLPMKMYFNPEEAALDVTRTYALVLQSCPLNECWLSAGDRETRTETETDYEVGTHTVALAGSARRRVSSDSDSLSAMEFRSGRWQPLQHTSVAATFYTPSSTEHGYRPNQLHSDWVAFHCNTTALEIKAVARFAATVPAYNSTNGKTLDVLAYSGYAGLGLFNPSSTTYFGDLRDQYGVDWEVLTRAGLTVAMVGYGQPNSTDTKRLLRRGATESGVVPPLVCGAIGGTQAEFAERYHSCDGVMEYDGDKPFDSGLGFHVPV